jgi:hypothetical protein
MKEKEDVFKKADYSRKIIADFSKYNALAKVLLKNSDTITIRPCLQIVFIGLA